MLVCPHCKTLLQTKQHDEDIRAQESARLKRVLLRTTISIPVEVSVEGAGDVIKDTVRFRFTEAQLDRLFNPKP